MSRKTPKRNKSKMMEIYHFGSFTNYGFKIFLVHEKLEFEDLDKLYDFHIDMIDKYKAILFGTTTEGKNTELTIDFGDLGSRKKEAIENLKNNIETESRNYLKNNKSILKLKYTSLIDLWKEEF